MIKTDKTLTAIFILPILNLNVFQTQTDESSVDAYLGIEPSPEEFGKSIYVKVGNLHEGLLRPDIEILDIGDGFLLKYTFTEEEYQTFVYLFMIGKYSLMNKSYVEEFFPLYDFREDGAHPSLYAKVFDKCDSLRQYWNERLGVLIAPGAEVWSQMIEEENTFFV